MAELYKEVARYRSDITNKRSGTTIDFQAVVFEAPDGRHYIRYSHTFKENGAAGFWYANSYTSAHDLETAEHLIQGWANNIENGYEVTTWSDI
ncbi:hypothetical protein SAMN05444404_1678 [Ruegeria lacuscaerulensis ITI-1157]|nr:hypothetical protein SAMN05444404_1678 [Ruegeria lacuscaerulensis ITI-1157]